MATGLHRIRQNYVSLKENITIESSSSPILDHLYEDNVLTADDCERIKNETTNSGRVERLLRIVLTKVDSYDTFCNALEKSHHEFLKEELEMTVVDEAVLQKEEQTIKEIISNNFVSCEESHITKDDIRDEIEDGYNALGILWLDQWNLVDSVIQKVFPNAKKKKKRRGKHCIYTGIKHVPEEESDEEISVDDNVNDERKEMQETEKFQDGTPLHEKSTASLCRILKPFFAKKGIDSNLLDTFEREGVSGELFIALTIEDTKDLFPDVIFGVRKKIIMIRDEMVKAEKNGIRFRDTETTEWQNSSTQSSISHDYEENECQSEKFRETFRKFGSAAKEVDRYMLNSIMVSDNLFPLSVCDTAHIFLHTDIDAQKIPFWIAEKTIPFLSACLNDRTNGTLHFGIQPCSTQENLQGNVVGIKSKKGIVIKKLYERIRKSFFDEDFEIVCKCMGLPQFIDVVPQKSDRKNDAVLGRFVVEIDIIPCYAFVQENVFYIKTEQVPGKLTSSMFRFMKGSCNPEKLDPEQVRQYMIIKSKLSQDRKLQEEKSSEGTIKKDLRQKFLNIFTAGNETITEEIYPVLLLSALDSSMNADFVAENFEFLHDIDPCVIFDFDSCSEDKGMYHFVEHDQERVLKVLTTDTFDRNSDEHTCKIDSLNNVLEDLRMSSAKPWVFCNGYEPLMKNPMNKFQWKQKRSEGFKEAVRFFQVEIPEHRAMVIFLLFSKAYDILLEAAEEVISKFKGQWILFAESEQIANNWKMELLRRDTADRKSLDERCIIGIPWKHVNSMIKHVMGTKSPCTCEIPTSTGAFCNLRQKVKNDLCDLEILSSNECDSDVEIIDDRYKREEHRKVVEQCFYKGGEVTWWNFWFKEDHVMKRSIHSRLLETIKEACKGSKDDEDNKVNIVNLIHQPGAGGTTSAKQILWEMRKKYRCAITRRISDYTCEQIEKFRSYEDPESPSPPIILIENDDEERVLSLCAHLKNRARILSRRSDEPCKIFCVVFLCIRRPNLPSSVDNNSVVLKHELSREELDWFNRKSDNLQRQHKFENGIDPTYLLSFNMMKENFNPEYIKRTVQEFVDNIEREKEQRLLCYLSLMNCFDLDFQPVPVSAFDPLMVDYTKGSRKEKVLTYGLVSKQIRCRTGQWETNLTQSLLVLINRKARVDFGSQLKGFYIINQLFAKEIFTYIRKKRTTSQMMLEFLESPLFQMYNRSIEAMKKIVKDILKKREILPSGKKEKFSPLIMDILKYEDSDTAGHVLERGFDMTDDPMVAQQVSRLYIDAQNWDKAEQYSIIATRMKPDNSYLWDTYGQIYKRRLTEMYLQCSQEESSCLSGDQVKFAIQLALEAIKNFKHEQETSEQENKARPNEAGYFAELRTVIILLDLLHFHPDTKDKNSLREFLVNAAYVPPFFRNLDTETINAIKEFQLRTYSVVQTIEEKYSQLKNDLLNDISLSTPIVSQRSTLTSLRENLDNYFGEDSDEIPADLSEEDKATFARRRIRRLGGSALPTILHHRLDHTGQEKLKVMRQLLLMNVNSQYCSLSDILTLISVTIVRNLNNGSCDDLEFINVLKWSKRAYDIALSTNEERPSLETFMFLVLLHWPTINRTEYLKYLCPIQQLQDVMKRWKIAYNKRYPGQKEENNPYRKRETTFFFLGKGVKFAEIVYYEDLDDKHGSRYFRGDSIWQKPKVRDQLQRLHGTLKSNGNEILIQFMSSKGNVNTLQIPTSLPIGQRTLWNKKVFFFVGFSWSGPKAFDVSQEENPPVTPSSSLKTNEGSSNRPGQLKQRYKDVSTNDNFLRKLTEINDSLQKIQRLKSFKKTTQREKEEIGKEKELKREKDELIRRRDEFLSGVLNATDY